MATYDKEAGLIPTGQEGSAQQNPETPDDRSADVRSTVESQFRQMDRAHDRIRAEELTARLAEPTLN
jgi:hypothetical protein